VYRGSYPTTLRPAMNCRNSEPRGALAQPVPRRSQSGVPTSESRQRHPIDILPLTPLLHHRLTATLVCRQDSCGVSTMWQASSHRSYALSARYGTVGQLAERAAHRHSRACFTGSYLSVDLYLEREPITHQDIRREVIEKQLALIHHEASGKNPLRLIASRRIASIASLTSADQHAIPIYADCHGHSC